MVKRFSEKTFFFDDANFRSILSRVETNFSRGFRNTTLEAVSLGIWGGFSWGLQPWGGVPGGQQAIRTYFPRETARASWCCIRLELEEAFTGFTLEGVSVIFSMNSPRFK